MESDIVSGYPSKSRNTPGGVYKLWYKEKGKTLRGSADGQSYASYVDYWNNVSTIGIGLHDASWQNGNFGGERYKSSTCILLFGKLNRFWQIFFVAAALGLGAAVTFSEKETDLIFRKNS